MGTAPARAVGYGSPRRVSRGSSPAARPGSSTDARHRAANELLHATGRHAGQVGIGNHRHERLLGAPPGLQQPVGEVRALPQLRDRELDRADARVPRPLPVSVADVDPLGRALPVRRTAERVRLRPHQRLRELLHHRAQEIRAGPLELLAQPAGDIHRGLDHRAPPRFVLTGRHEDDAVVSYIGPCGPAVACSLASLTGSEPATELTSSRSNTTSGDATRHHRRR